MYGTFQAHLTSTLDDLTAAGLRKSERILASAQGVELTLQDGRRVINLCANNYLGLANHPEVVAAARASYERWGYGLSSVRFICGTQALHRQLEEAISRFLGTEDTILYSSCFDANGGLFEPLLAAQDAILSDELNHASIIDGVRLCKAPCARYRNNDLADLEEKLRGAASARFRLIATDGVFSMDGTVARLDGICDLAERHDALVMIDDSHAVGFMGPRGRGTHEYRGCLGRVDVITGTLGKALGGASGGYTSGRREIVDLLRQRSRPYLFSNTLAPAIAAASLKVLELLEASTELRDRLHENTQYFRAGLRAVGFDIPAGEHPIVPILLGDARLAQAMAARLLERGIYAIGFSYPVVPRDRARIRTQVSAAHTHAHLDRAIEAFGAVRRELGLSASLPPEAAR